MRLFTAIRPSDQAIQSLRDELALLDREGLRWPHERGWHITLGFYGNHDDPETRHAWLAERLAGQPAFTARLAGAGQFPRVLWIGVRGDRLPELAAAAGAETGREFRAHLTVAKGRPSARIVDRLSGYLGPEWPVTEVALIRSELDSRGASYTVLHRYPLVTG